jgi:hypothetical protein
MSGQASIPVRPLRAAAFSDPTMAVMTHAHGLRMSAISPCGRRTSGVPLR